MSAEYHVLERVELYVVRLLLRHRFETSSHGKGELDHIVVRAIDDHGHEGWGEAASPTEPYYGPETVDTCWSLLTDHFVPAILGRPWASPDQASSAWRQIRGNHFARAALDIACWDLIARAGDQSVASLLGGTRGDVLAGVSLGIEPTLDALLEQIELHVANGYRRVKLKIGPGWDVVPAQAVRARYPDLPLQVDANGAYAGMDDLRTFEALDELGLAMIEQPFPSDELLLHARLQERLRTPICLDESIASLGQARTALALDACRVVNVKVSRMGGIGPARDLHDLCRSAGVSVWCGGMHEFGIGRAANIALSSLAGFELPGDISGSDKYFESDIVDPLIRAADGRIEVPFGRPGLGFEPNVERISRLAIRSTVVSIADVRT